MSIGGPGQTWAERNAVRSLYNAGIFLVAATGNSGRPGDGNPLEYPAGYPQVMGVGAIDSSKNIADFSSYGNQVSVVAPGVGVTSLSIDSASPYVAYDGTSMATPHVAGVAALLKSIKPDASPAELRRIIESTAEDLGGTGQKHLKYGYGLVNAFAAAQEIMSGGIIVGSCNGGGCVNVRVVVLTDDYGSETSWKIMDARTNQIVRTGGPYTNGRRTTQADEMELSSGCYKFEIIDAYKDGYVYPMNLVLANNVKVYCRRPSLWLIVFCPDLI
jgi:subtilisin family serine protease